MVHKTRADQFHTRVKAQKDPQKLAKQTKVHHPKRKKDPLYWDMGFKTGRAPADLYEDHNDDSTN